MHQAELSQQVVVYIDEKLEKGRYRRDCSDELFFHIIGLNGSVQGWYKGEK